MDVIGVIPARYESTRLPHKLLKTILGKPLIQWTWEAAKQAHLIDELIIACDHPEIEKTAEAFGARVLFTSPQHISGTDRICEVIDGVDTKIVINIQADEPLIHPSVINSLAMQMRENTDLVMATAKTKITKAAEIDSPHVVKVVTDKDDFALYFSRYGLPYRRDPQGSSSAHHKHIGIYAYTKEFLYVFKNLPHSPLEEAEKLEQLRVLEAGYKIKVIETTYDAVGVDTQEDLENVEEILRGRTSTFDDREEDKTPLPNEEL